MRISNMHIYFASLLIFLSLFSQTAYGEVIFEESFDDQPDFHSGMPENSKSGAPIGLPDRVQRATTHTIPEDWYSLRQDPKWSPSLGHPDRHETIEILQSNAEKSRGGSGKSMVNYRHGYNNGQGTWTSESLLLKYFPEGYDQLYVEFWIRFGPNWTRELRSGQANTMSKIFRILSWNEKDSEFENFSDGSNGPIIFWDHGINSYGLRNEIALRGGPHGDNYGFQDPDIPGLPRRLDYIGNLSLNWAGNLKDMGPNGTRSYIEDRVNGGVVPTGDYDIVQHDQIFGPGESWTKIAFFVKMNSSPGAKDGVLRQWLNDHQIFFNTQIPWIRSSSKNTDAQWNIVGFGGNDYFYTYDNSERREEWYSIDDIVIRTDIPDYVDSQGAITAPPSPPSGISVQ